MKPFDDPHALRDAAVTMTPTKTEQQLRRERRIGLIVSITVTSIAIIAWLTLKFVMGFSRIGANS